MQILSSITLTHSLLKIGIPYLRFGLHSAVPLQKPSKGSAVAAIERKPNAAAIGVIQIEFPVHFTSIIYVILGPIADNM